MKKVLLSDIAEKVGKSPTMVSRALRGTGRVAPETRAEILRVANELNYRTVKKRDISRIAVISEMYSAQNIELLKELDRHGLKGYLILLDNLDFNEDAYFGGAVFMGGCDIVAQQWFEKHRIPLIAINDYGFCHEQIS